MAKKKVTKTAKPKKAFVLIRATGADAQLIENLKKLTREKTSSGAMLTAGRRFIELQNEVEARKLREQKLIYEMRELQELTRNTFNGLHMLLKWGNDKLPKGHSTLPGQPGVDEDDE